MRDWTNAGWIDPTRPWTDPLPVPEFPERLLVDFATRCNLRCPMCPVWGSDDERAIDEVRGIMDLAAARRMLDEVMGARPMVAPSVYGEPLLIPDLRSVFTQIDAPVDRRPCPAIYKTLPVHNDGTVRLCCLDGFRATAMGNIFTDGVKTVWQGEEFAKARYYHETGQWDKVPFCKPCNGWVQYDYEEEIRDGILVRRSPQFTYYNKIDRLKNWKGSLLGGHKPPPSHLVDASAP